VTLPSDPRGDDWDPDEPYFVMVGTSPCAWKRIAEEAGEGGRVDFTMAPRRKLRWVVFKKRFHDEREQYQIALDTWYADARRAAGLPRIATPTDVDRHRRELDRHPYPQIDGALQRLERLTRRHRFHRIGWRVEGDAIEVELRPFRKQQVRLIAQACHPVPVRVTKARRN
jgi:hypothetical protein